MRKQYAMVLNAISEGANTSRDLADVTGQDINTVSSVVSKMITAGILKRTGGSIPNLNPRKLGHRYRVFELVRKRR